ncbi:MAG: hypothetical protein ACHRHE_04380 [Tepidisphaerales bacterium]
MDTPPIPLPVQPLNYEPPQHNSWTVLVRLLGCSGLLLGAMTVLEASLPYFRTISWSGQDMPMSIAWLAATGVSLLASTAGIGVIVASAQFLRRIDNSVLMQVSMIALACLSILKGALSAVQTSFALRSSFSMTKSELLGYVASILLRGIHLALLPLLIALVVKVGRKDARYRAVFIRI